MSMVCSTDCGSHVLDRQTFGRLAPPLCAQARNQRDAPTGRMRQSSYEAEGATRYTVDLLADGFAILAKANGKSLMTSAADMHDSGLVPPSNYYCALMRAQLGPR